ncbi:hypothetical protein TgHK011_008558 [Trichoderma gracile]|nr:hypothetical protein TgHK011_008558 [Trichoderma gracile]
MEAGDEMQLMLVGEGFGATAAATAAAADAQQGSQHPSIAVEKMHSRCGASGEADLRQNDAVAARRTPESHLEAQGRCNGNDITGAC